MGKVIEYFAREIENLTHAEKQVLYFIEENLEEVKKSSLTVLAEKNNVSNTTIIRMCQRLGLAGFSELKFVLKNMTQKSVPVYSNILERYQNEMNHVLSALDPNYIQKVTEVIDRSSRIVILAVGLSKMSGEYLSKLFMQVNKPSTYMYESHIIDLLPNMIQPKDLIVFISSSGETKTLVKVAERLRYKNVETLSITNNTDSTLARVARYKLSADVEHVQFAGYDLTARSTLIVLMDILFEFYLKTQV